MSGESGEIWLLDHGDFWGGGQGFGFRLAGALRAAGRNVTVGCPRESPLSGWCRERGIDVVEMTFPAPSPWKLLSVAPAVARIRRFLKGLARDALVIGNHPRVHAYLYAATRGPAVTATIVNVAHEQESARRPSARFAYGRFGALLAVGTNAADEYRSRLPGVPITEVNNFLPVEYFEQARARRVLSPAHSELALGVLARMIPEKGIAELVEELAAAAVRPRWSRLLVGGAFQDASYARRVEHRVEELGLGDRIALLGDVADVPGFLGSVDALLVPSTGSEAQPTVILEGLAHGVPVVVRSPLYSADYRGLPVTPYRDAGDLASVLYDLPLQAAPVDELIRRFGPEQAIAGLEGAAQLARARS